MPLTTKAASELAKFVFGGEDIAFGPQLKIALYKSSPSATGGGTEITGGGYQRISVDRNSSQWANDDPNDLSYTYNQQVIQFPCCNGGLGDCDSRRYMGQRRGAGLSIYVRSLVAE